MPGVIPAGEGGLTWCSLALDPTAGANAGADLELAVAENGTGPTVLLVARMHGDEAEGEEVLRTFLHGLDVSALAGRLIVVPCANRRAVQNGTRTAPEDGLDLNRVMPGRPNGSPTERVAHLIATNLLPEAEIVVDLHSGGSAYVSADLAWVAPPAEPAARRRTFEAARAFGAPFTLVADGSGAGTLAAAAEGKLYIATDGAGPGPDTRAFVRGMGDGLVRLLRHLGLLGGTGGSPLPTRLVNIAPGWGERTAPFEGRFEPLVEVGGNLAEGEAVGLLHPDDPATPAFRIVAPASSYLLGRAPAGAVAKGERILVLGVDCPPALTG